MATENYIWYIPDFEQTFTQFLHDNGIPIESKPVKFKHLVGESFHGHKFKIPNEEMWKVEKYGKWERQYEKLRNLKNL